MRLVFIFLLFCVGFTLIPNVDSTPRRHRRRPIDHHGGHQSQRINRILATLRKYLHGQTIHPVIDGINEGIFELIMNSVGHGKHRYLLGLLSAIPENSDLVELLGGSEACKKSKQGRLSQVDALLLLIKVSKLRCARTRCQVPTELQPSDDSEGQDSQQGYKRSKKNNLSKKIDKLLKKFFGDLNTQFDNVLDEISSGLEEILKRLLGAEKEQSVLLGLLSRISKERDIKYLLDGEEEVTRFKDGLVSRVEIFRILIQVAKMKCTYRKCKIPNIENDSSDDDIASDGSDQPGGGKHPKPPKKNPPKDDDDDDIDDNESNDGNRPKTKPPRGKPTKGDEDDEYDSSDGSNSKPKNPKRKPPKDGDDGDDDDNEDSDGGNYKPKPPKRKPSKNDDDEDDFSEGKHRKPKPPKGKPPRDDDDDEEDPDEGKHRKPKPPKGKPPKGNDDGNDESCSGKPSKGKPHSCDNEKQPRNIEYDESKSVHNSHSSSSQKHYRNRS